MALRASRFWHPIPWAASLAFSAAFSSAVAGAEARKEIVNIFDRDRESWQIYDYNGGIAGGGNVFFLASWEKTGGVENSGYIWADDSRWRIDTPEDPHSILAFILYQRWVALDAQEPARETEAPRPTGYVKGEELDLREAEVSVYLRGDGLDLKGAKCYFWVFDSQTGSRWHYTAKPLKVSDGQWGERQTFVLKNDEALWHRSWSWRPQNPGSLDQVLSGNSYGFAFVGFSEEVTGRFSMDEFRIRLRPQPKRP